MFPNLIQYIENNGGDCSAVEIRNTTTAGRGLFVKSILKKDQLIFRIPHSCLITETSILENELGRIAATHAQKQGFQVPPRILMSIYLMGESAKLHNNNNNNDKDDLTISSSSSSSSNSTTTSTTTPSISSYIYSLPKTYGTPPFVAQHDAGLQLQSLLHTPVGTRETERRTLMRNTYDAFFPSLSHTHPQHFPIKHCTFANYIWAHSSICTRLFPTEFLTIGNVTHTGQPALNDGKPDPCGL